MAKKSFFILQLLILLSCNKVYTVSNAKIVAANHEIIAIIPPRVSINASQRSKPNDHKAIENSESENYQKEIYFWFLQQKMEGKMLVDIQDVDLTNTILQKHEFFSGKAISPDEICTLLGVDALVRSNFSITQNPKGLAVVSTVVSNFRASTHKVDVFLELYDKELKRLIWMFKDDLYGRLQHSSSDVVSALMRQASTKLPYLK